MGNPIYAVPKSKSEFTHVYIQVRSPRPQPPLGIFPHTGPRSSSSTIAGRRTGRQSRLWTENLTRHDTTTATILCARRQNILPDCVSFFFLSFFHWPRLQLRVRDQSGSDVYFKMKRRLPLGLLQDAYCQREQLDLSKLCFLYKGRRIIPDETPEELDMEQVVTVDVVKLD